MFYRVLLIFYASLEAELLFQCVNRKWKTDHARRRVWFRFSSYHNYQQCGVRHHRQEQSQHEQPSHDGYVNVIVNAPAASCMASPASKLTAVCNVPYQSMLLELTGEPSNSTSPDAAPGDENGPNKSTAVLDADCCGEAAAPNNADTRLKFVWLPISLAFTEVGIPMLSPAQHAVGCVAAAAPVLKSR